MKKTAACSPVRTIPNALLVWNATVTACVGLAFAGAATKSHLILKPIGTQTARWVSTTADWVVPVTPTGTMMGPVLKFNLLKHANGWAFAFKAARRAWVNPAPWTKLVSGLTGRKPTSAQGV